MQIEVNFTGNKPAVKYDMETQLINKNEKVHPACYVYIEKITTKIYQ